MEEVGHDSVNAGIDGQCPLLGPFSLGQSLPEGPAPEGPAQHVCSLGLSLLKRLSAIWVLAI